MATSQLRFSDPHRRLVHCGGGVLAVALATAPPLLAQEPTPTPEPTPVHRPVLLVDPLGDPAPAQGFDSYDALGWAMFVAFVIFAAWIVWWFYKKAQDAVGGGGSFNSVEEAVFEREAIRGVAIPPPDKPPAETPAPATLVVPTKVSPPPPGFPFGPPAAPTAGPVVETAAGDLGRRLQALGVFDSIEGTVPLPVPPDGVIWRLKRGGTALVLPRAESDATMAHFAQRFDYVIAPAAGGEALVVRRLENQIGDWTRS